MSDHIDLWVLFFSVLMVGVTIWMGFWSARKSRTASDFFVAGRSVSVGWNASAISGEYLSAASFMGVAGMVMSSGYDALWYPVCYACGYLFLLLFIAGPLRRFGAYTIPDFAEGRFDSPLFRKIAVIFVLCIGFFYTMPQMKGAGTALAYILPGIPYWAGVALVGAVITFNVALGGMKGITLVQAFQYWAKMFAISVPVFILMSVYGDYGAHLGANDGSAAARQGRSEIHREKLPAKAPPDLVWISPFGNLTTKAVKASNAAHRWNLSETNRATLVDFSGNPPPSRMSRLVDKAEDYVSERLGKKSSTPAASIFSDWTNMPSGTAKGYPAIRGPVLLREYALISGKPVVAATNILTAPGLDRELSLFGSFHSKAEFVAYLESVLGTNGVHLVHEPNRTVAIPEGIRGQFQKNAASVALVPYELRGGFPAPQLTLPLFLETEGRSTFTNGNLKFYSSKDVVSKNISVNPSGRFMLAAEAKALMDAALKKAGVTLIPAGDEMWAVSSAQLPKFERPPLDPRPYSLLYTYSLILALVCGTAGLPHILVRFYTNPDGVAAKRTTMWVMILIGIFYVFPPVFGVMGRNLLPELYNGLTGVQGTDGVVLKLPIILKERFGVLGPILSGVACAGAFAAFMSTFSGLLVSMTGALAHDVYGRILKPRSTPAERMRMFKICAIVCGLGSVLLGLLVEKFEINKVVGWAFAIAAASYFPLLFMCTWWRGMTMKGAAAGMLVGGSLSLVAVVSTMLADQAAWASSMASFYLEHPLLRILAEQPAIWGVPVAILLMILVSKATRDEVPKDIRMKMLVLHAPEKLGLKQEYIQEHEGMGH